MTSATSLTARLTARYGMRNGAGPTAGKKAGTFIVRFPDGTATTKRAFDVNEAVGKAVCYEHIGKWYVSGIYTEVPAWALRPGVGGPNSYTIVDAERIK